MHATSDDPTPPPPTQAKEARRAHSEPEVTRGFQRLEAAAPSASTKRIAQDVKEGLSARPKYLPAYLLYDTTGSALFRRITTLDAYYPTRSERRIFETRGAELVAPLANAPCTVIDLGAGDGHKAAILLRHLGDAGSDVTYAPVDVSEGAMMSLIDHLHGTAPDVPVTGIVGRYLDGVGAIMARDERRKLVLFLGSNIGNFGPNEARAFLSDLRDALSADDFVLVGFDLCKSTATLIRAYDDPEGVTRAFNLNLLRRLNRELGATFDLAAFEHYASYNADTRAMESRLLSTVEQEVYIGALDEAFSFAAWEPIQTESSYKYRDADIDDLARSAGFEVQRRCYDAKRWYCNALLHRP